MKIGIIGRGKVGRTLAAELRAAGFMVTLCRGRRKTAWPAASCDTWLVAVPDASIPLVADRIAPHVSARQVVLHCAGSLGPEALEVCHERGAATATFHPLVSFVACHAPRSLRGSSFLAHGDARAIRAARTLARSLGSHLVTAPIAGPNYHAAAALVANGGAALAWAGVEILTSLGLSRPSAQRALGSLLSSVALNVAQVGTPAALSGPVARGDAHTVSEHLRALASLDPRLAAAYRAVQPVVIECARAKGLAPSRARALARRLARESPQRQR